MEHFLSLLQNNTNTLAAAILFISIFVEITPIKVNPLSHFTKWFGDCLNKDTREKLSSISLQIDAVSDRIDKIELNDTRTTILDFANSCMNGHRHTKEEFEHIIDLHTQYEDTIVKKGMKNGRVELAFQYISELYDKCLHENSFLNNGRGCC